MKQLLLLIIAITLSFGFGACASSSSTPSTVETNKPVPPGSGGRGDTPGQHAESQNPR